MALIGYNVLQVKHIKVVGDVSYSPEEIAKLAAIPNNTQMLQVNETS